jgi:hypothetical protein
MRIDSPVVALRDLQIAVRERDAVKPSVDPGPVDPW